MRKSRVLATLIVSVLTASLVVSSPANAEPAFSPCPFGEEYRPITAKAPDMQAIYDLVDFCVAELEFGSGTIELGSIGNHTQYTFRLKGLASVISKGNATMKAMHQQEPNAAYVLPGETVTFFNPDLLTSLRIDSARSARWTSFSKATQVLLDEGYEVGSSFLLAKISPARAALWKCTTGAYSAGKTMAKSEIDAQEFVDAAIGGAATAFACKKSWDNYVVDAEARTGKRAVQLQVVEHVVEGAEYGVTIRKLWTALLDVCPRFC